MNRTWSLTKKQMVVIIGYALVFPLTNMVGGTIAQIGITLTIPFLPFAWMFGVYFSSLVGNESTYLLGAFIAIFFQVWLCAVIRAGFKRRTNELST